MGLPHDAKEDLDTRSPGIPCGRSARVGKTTYGADGVVSLVSCTVVGMFAP